MAFRLSLFYGSIFLVIGVMLPFWPLWLEARGMTPEQIGMLLAAGMIVRAFASPLIAQAGDRRGRPDRMLVALGWASVAAYALFAAAHGFWALLAVTVVSTMAFTAMIPIGDAVTMLKVREGALEYGRVRLWGSITFIAAAAAGGTIIAGRPESTILWLILGALALTAIACHLVPHARTDGGGSDAKAPILTLLRDGRFVAFTVCASLLQASHGVYYGFATIHWRAAGLGETVIGALWAEGVIAEIVLFALAGRVMARVGPAKLLAVAAAGGTLRWCVLGLTTELPALVAVQWLHAATFGAGHLAAMYFIARHVPAGRGGTAQSLYSSTAVGIAMGLSTMASGALYGTLGGHAFLAMAALSLAGGAGAVALARRGG